MLGLLLIYSDPATGTRPAILGCHGNRRLALLPRAVVYIHLPRRRCGVYVSEVWIHAKARTNAIAHKSAAC